MNQQDKRGLIVASAIGVLVILLFKVFGTLTTTNANGEVEVIRMRDLLESPMSVEQAFQTGKAAKKSSHSGFAFKPLPASKNPIVAKKKPELKVADNKKKPKKDKKKATKKKKQGLEVLVVEKVKEESRSNNDEPEVSGGFANNSAQKTEEEKRPRTLEEWVDYIAASPSLDRFQEFYNAYLQNEVSREMYFDVAVALLEYKSDDVNRIGLTALTSVTGPEAFLNLALIAENHPQRKIRAGAVISLNAYTALKYVNLLNSSLRSDDTIVRYYSAVLAEKSAVRNMVLSETSIQSGRPIRPGEEEVPFTFVKNAEKYTRITQTLTAVSNSDKNSSVRSAALQAKLTIERILNSSPNPPNPQGPPSPAFAGMGAEESSDNPESNQDSTLGHSPLDSRNQ